jgi:fructose-1-phosphate kinase PfkB-like protein
MQCESIPSPAIRHDETARNLLYLLTAPRDGQPLWASEDLARELETSDVEPLLRTLRGAGLIYKTSDGFVFASRAGVRVVQMIGAGV